MDRGIKAVKEYLDAMPDMSGMSIQEMRSFFDQSGGLALPDRCRIERVSV